jgi:hypothetical protein
MKHVNKFNENNQERFTNQKKDEIYISKDDKNSIPAISHYFGKYILILPFSDDWEGLYIDNNLISEGHSLEVRDVNVRIAAIRMPSTLN